MNLLIEYFKSQNSDRDNEYLFCINQNILNESIKKIYVFISDDSPLSLESEKIQIVKLYNRPTFYEIFEFCNNNLHNEICIIANTDIIFDETLNHLKEFNFSSIFLSLTRWDIAFIQNQWRMRYYELPWRDGITTGQMSQDTWIFKSPILLDERSRFMMGKPGCDNRISQILHENGYDVRNPSKKIIIKHLHQTNYRTYDVYDTIPGPYLLIDPTEDINKQSNKKTIPHF